MARTTSQHPTNDQAAKASAAAMDALNLDDLFLDNDDQGDSLFADMDIDLGDMDGIIGEAAGDVMSEEFGGFFRQEPDTKEEEIAALDKGTQEIVPAAETSPLTVRTRRRKSRKTDENDDSQQPLNGNTTSEVSTGKKSRSSSSGVATKGKKRRGGSSRVTASLPSQDAIPATSLLATDSIGTQHQILTSSIDFMPQKTKRGILPTRKNAMKEHAQPPSASSSATISQHSPSKNNLPTHTNLKTAHPQAPQSALNQQPTEEQKKWVNIQRAQALVSNYGLEPSRTRFFPYMPLPPEVEVKKGLEAKKGQKAFPLLDKLIHASAPDGNNEKGKRDEKEKDSTNDAEKLLPKTSPLYTLFNQHLGALVDNHGNHHTPEALQKSLHKAKLLASSYLKSNRQPLIDELSKLLASCIKQSAFLRQNLWNMEEWAEDHFGKEDFEASFPARRRDVERIVMREKGIVTRGINSYRLGVSNTTNGSIHYFPTSVVATNAQSLPSPESMPNAPTHGGPNLTPVISVKVKVKCHGWKPNGAFREKFMRNGLEARMWSPVGWKIAAQRANVALAETIAAATAAEAATDAAELSPAVAEAVALETLKPYERTDATPNAAPPSSPSKSRKRKLKHGSIRKEGNAADKSSSGDAFTLKASTTSSAAHLVPHIPHHTSYHPSVLSPTALKQIRKDHYPVYNQQPHIIHFLHTKLLNPSTAPTERRILLANEISSTLQRMENARLSHQWTRARQIQKELNDLQSIYEEDLDTVPETCNTIGMWRWMERTNFHNKLDEEDVYSGLEGCWQPELDQPQSLDDEGCWGSFLPMAKVSSKVVDRRSKVKRKVDSIEGDAVEEVMQDPSPLFDRLQSLLVEVDDISDDSENDNDFLLNLPSYSPEQFVHGPKEDLNPDDNAVLDVSALTLDQRTFIQLRAARLIDSSTTPDNPPLVLDDESSSSSSSPRSSDYFNDESIDTILQSMKSHLSSLHVDINNSVATLQRVALSYASNTPARQQKERDEEAVLAKYQQYQNALKVQKDEKAEKEEKRRISGRIKTGSYKVDGEVWLPW